MSGMRELLDLADRVEASGRKELAASIRDVHASYLVADAAHAELATRLQKLAEAHDTGGWSAALSYAGNGAVLAAKRTTDLQTDIQWRFFCKLG